ncbi:iron uptake system protein EfeO [Pseudochrobactrum algeriensis]|nr:iron uptake system protein EfeO [Pseudochrobactrum algeriensis]
MSKNPSAPSSGLMKLAVAGSAVLAVAAGGLFYYATITKNTVGNEKLIPIEVGAKACEPMNLTLPSGFHSFEIHNRSDRPVEWEILDGVMVVEERENIIPGMKSVLRAQLLPGEYEITCGLLSNPRGKLTVTPSEHSKAAVAAKPDTRAFIGMLSEYKVFLVMQSNAALKNTQALQAAIAAGNVQAARAAFSQAREAYERTDVLSGRFSDLASKIDPLANYLEKREEDPAFTGFHRIEYGLWAQNSTAGLDIFASQLATDLTELKERLKTTKLTPDMLLRSLATYLNQQAEGAVIAGDNAYSHLDLADLTAKLDGAEKILTLLKPLSEKPAASETQNALFALQDVRQELTTLSAGNPERSYAEIDDAARRALAEKVRTLSQKITALMSAIGLE